MEENLEELLLKDKTYQELLKKSNELKGQYYADVKKYTKAMSKADSYERMGSTAMTVFPTATLIYGILNEYNHIPLIPWLEEIFPIGVIGTAIGYWLTKKSEKLTADYKAMKENLDAEYHAMKKANYDLREYEANFAKKYSNKAH